MTYRRKQFLLLALPLAIVLVGGVLWYRFTTSVRPLTVLYKNTSRVVIVDISEEQAGGKEKQIAVIKKSGDTVKINKNISVFVRYLGAVGYTDGFENGAGRTVTIDPEYSRDKIDSIIASQRTRLETAIFNSIENEGLYNLEKGTLFDHGRWYISKLVPKTNTEDSLDSLRVLVKREGNAWKLIEKPNLVFTVHNTDGVPVKVLDAVNTY